jgi:hypothetical protein
MCRMRRPVREQNIYIVGEAYSFQQGWVEGALDIAESTLEDFFDLDRPSWLDANYPLMPNPCPGCVSLEGCLAPILSTAISPRAPLASLMFGARELSSTHKFSHVSTINYRQI